MMRPNLSPLLYDRTIALTLCFMPVSMKPCIARKTADIPAFLKQTFHADAEKRTFAELAVLLREKYRVSILTDGESKRENVTMGFDGNLKTALDKIADAFDYTWTTKSGIVLMNKRFKSKDEQPQANLSEMRQMTKEIVGIFHSVPFNADSKQWSPMLQNLAHSFSPEQAQILLDGQTLQGSQLSAPQLSLLTQAIYTRTFAGPLPVWEALLFQLEGISSSYLLAKLRNEQTESDVPQPPFDLFYMTRDKTGKVLSETIPFSFAPKEDKP